MGMRVAVIGVGSMGRNHARVYNELPEVELLAVSDANEKAAHSIANQFSVHAYTDYRELFDKEKPEAISIAVPTVKHEEVALAALEAGIHILLEKPIAATVEEGRRIIEKAEQTDRVLMVGHIVRFNPAIRALKERLDAGDLGQIFQIFCRRSGPFPARAQDVGVVIDLAPHDIDIMRFITGKNPTRVYAETERRIHTEHEDLLFGVLHFPDRITGALEINWLTPTKIREVLVLGERGMFRVDDLTQDLYFYENAQAAGVNWSALATLKGVSEGSMTRFALQRYEPLKTELQAFIKAVRGEAEIAVSGEDGLAALRFALALVESGMKHQVINI
jgi:UDP-N-acetylglucosamine 3-dehydrogenase